MQHGTTRTPPVSTMSPEMRQDIQRLFHTRDRAVTTQDIALFASTYIAKYFGPLSLADYGGYDSLTTSVLDRLPTAGLDTDLYADVRVREILYAAGIGTIDTVAYYRVVHTQRGWLIVERIPRLLVDL